MLTIFQPETSSAKLSREPDFAALFGSLLSLPAGIDSAFECALRHVLENPGSLIRPQLVYRIARAYGLDENAAIRMAVALEYFHTASLLFDDLPCMDDASERRGTPCTHLVFGQESAILAALALINRAYALVWQAVAGVPRSVQPEALAYLERNLGVMGLLNGQSLDLHYAALPQNLQTTEAVARGKTVSLIRLTLVLPAMLGGAPARELRCLERISLFWGLSYQIVDDLKDVLETAEQSGKTSARDQILGRPNLAVVLGVSAAEKRLARLLELGDRATLRLLGFRPEVAFLSRLRAELERELQRVTGHAGLYRAGGLRRCTCA